MMHLHSFLRDVYEPLARDNKNSKPYEAGYWLRYKLYDMLPAGEIILLNEDKPTESWEYRYRDSKDVAKVFTAKATKVLYRAFANHTELVSEATISNFSSFLGEVEKILSSKIVVYAETPEECEQAYKTVGNKVNSDSCMKDTYFVRWYGLTGKSKIAMLMDENNVYRARAVVWETEQGYTVLDRCYPNNSVYSKILRNWADEQGMLVRSDDSAPGDHTTFVDKSGTTYNDLSVRVRGGWGMGEFPYLDTFRSSEWHPMNKEYPIDMGRYGKIRFTSTGGSYSASDEDNSLVKCYVCDETIKYRNCVAVHDGSKYGAYCQEHAPDICASCGNSSASSYTSVWSDKKVKYCQWCLEKYCKWSIYDEAWIVMRYYGIKIYKRVMGENGIYENNVEYAHNSTWGRYGVETDTGDIYDKNSVFQSNTGVYYPIGTNLVETWNGLQYRAVDLILCIDGNYAKPNECLRTYGSIGGNKVPQYAHVGIIGVTHIIDGGYYTYTIKECIDEGLITSETSLFDVAYYTWRICVDYLEPFEKRTVDLGFCTIEIVKQGFTVSWPEKEYHYVYSTK